MDEIPIWTPYHGLIDLAKTADAIQDEEMKALLKNTANALANSIVQALHKEEGDNVATFPRPVN